MGIQDNRVEIAITFGVQYGRDPLETTIHPQGMTGNGYAVIVAPTREMAREAAFKLWDKGWAFDYPLDEFLSSEKRNRWHPEGELARYEVSRVGHVWETYAAPETVALRQTATTVQHLRRTS